MVRRIGASGLLVAMALFLAACQSSGVVASDARPVSATPIQSTPTSPDPGRPIRSTVRDSGAGGVTVEATWLGSQEDGGLAFKVALDTHSVDLSRFDVVENVLLRDGAGRELRASDWRDERRDSHHRAGTLRFPALPPGSDRSRVTLVVQDLAGIAERTLIFEFQR